MCERSTYGRMVILVNEIQIYHANYFSIFISNRSCTSFSNLFCALILRAVPLTTCKYRKLNSNPHQFHRDSNIPTPEVAISSGGTNPSAVLPWCDKGHAVRPIIRVPHDHITFWTFKCRAWGQYNQWQQKENLHHISWSHDLHNDYRSTNKS